MYPLAGPEVKGAHLHTHIARVPRTMSVMDPGGQTDNIQNSTQVLQQEKLQAFFMGPSGGGQGFLGSAQPPGKEAPQNHPERDGWKSGKDVFPPLRRA